MKRTYNTYQLYIYIFSWPRIQKDYVIAIIVIETALNKLNVPYITFAKLTWSLILFWKIDNIFTSLIESGTSSNISGAKDARLSLP